MMTAHPAFLGVPQFTYSDVERALSTWVVESGLIEKYASVYKSDMETSERALLAKLKAKYEPDATEDTNPWPKEGA